MVNNKPETVDEAYLEALNKSIGSEMVLSAKYAIHVLSKVKKWKRDTNILLIGDSNSNPTPDTPVYEI